jgi:Ala-tRNA(Pro) deacylase
MNIYDFLNHHNIRYQQFDHPAVYTCEEAEKLCPDMPGQSIKNLFLRDKGGERYFLIVVSKNKKVDLKELGRTINVSKLSFASPEHLQKYLGVKPGAVSLLGVVNDSQNNVEVIIDQEIWKQPLQCHPLVNTATLVMPFEGIEHFLKETNHDPKVMNIPVR